MKSPLFFTAVILPALVTSSFAQEATGAQSATASSVFSSPGSTATSSLDLEDEWVECFKDCFRKYGKLDSCPYADTSFDACWCTDDDWTEREEDCVWDVCSPAAKNGTCNIRLGPDSRTSTIILEKQLMSPFRIPHYST